ncbi:LysR family transcriptional regulator [Pseudoroseomonas deserti]|uniref:LysR family transcriptional regulator n=1 Tax=Teichococcus deserti TaxID=1817963 RepID=A0A1V2GYY7_9PROT|nr:LysR family transcriptional regulator [Pseudoroseomonas deserti]ONG50126.1 LysR family transcriptional regulator [Pseudoroseomonas deserti]
MAKSTPIRPLAPDWFARARLKLRHLQLLVALDELRNLNRAAQSLGLTQPAASRLLAEVEQMVGGAVFERRPRGVEPNGLGEVLLRRARIVLVELQQAATELNGLRSGSGGAVAIGAVTAPAVDAVMQAVEAMQRDTPGLQVTVEVEPSARLIEGLRRGRLDLALARIPAGVQAGELDYREVGEEELCFLVRDSHPLLGRERIGLEELLGFTWLLEPAGSLLRQAVEMLFARHGLPMPGRVINTASILLNLAALGRSDAVSVVSAPVAAMLGAQGRFRRLPPLREAEVFAVSPYGLIRMRDRPLSPAAARLQAVLEPMLFPG